MIISDILCAALGVGATIGFYYAKERYDHWRFEREIIKVFEFILFTDLEIPDELVCDIVPSIDEPGVVAMKIRDSNMLYFARADGLKIKLIKPLEYAALAGLDAISILPCEDDDLDGIDED
jgi:hypothetical protein